MVAWHSTARNLCVVVVGGLLLIPAVARAVPSFARQTGFECTTCHLSWPELTSVGRQFKLGGYTLMKSVEQERPWLAAQSDGPPPKLPLAGMVQLSATNTNGTSGADPSNFPRNNSVVLQQASLFYAGRIAEYLGAFAQWTYDGVAHHSSVDNVDIRFANRLKHENADLSYGLTLNNNPTVSDIYNTTPAWSFPFASSSVAVTPNAAALIDGGLGQQVVGFGAYGLWNETLYTEIAAYRTADDAFSIFRAGTDKTTDAVLGGYAPYWRLALQHVWGEGTHSAMIGTYGINARKFPDSLDPTGPTDRFETWESTRNISTSPTAIASPRNSTGSTKGRISTRHLAAAARVIHQTGCGRSRASSPTTTIQSMGRRWVTSAPAGMQTTASITPACR
jgi:hypothetical protein